MRGWTKKEVRILRARYAATPTATIAAQLGRSVSSVYQKAALLGLYKSAAYLASEASGRISKLTHGGRVYRFKKGMTPWNKGIHHSPAGAEKGRFKPGNKPQTWRPIGSERLDKDGVLMRKVSDTGVRRNDWRPVHVLIWESLHGHVPAGKFIIFSDRNQKNFAPENLLCVTRRENMLRNSYHRYPPELARVIQLRGALNRQINRRLHENH